MNASADRLAMMDLAARYMCVLDRLDQTLLEAQFCDDARLCYGIFEGRPREFCVLGHLKVSPHQT